MAVRARRIREGAERGGRDDLVRQYLDELGAFPLLTAADEAELSAAIQAGSRSRGDPRPETAGTPTASGSGRGGLGEVADRRADGGRRPSPLHPVQPAPRRVGREAVPGVRAAHARPDPGGQPRTHAGGREVRPPQGLQVLDVRDVVDPPGHHPRYRRQEPHYPGARPPGRHALGAGADLVTSVEGARPRADRGGAGDGDRFQRREDRGRPEDRARPDLAVDGHRRR